MINKIKVIHLESTAVLHEAIQGLLPLCGGEVVWTSPDIDKLFIQLESPENYIIVMDDVFARNYHGSLQLWEILCQKSPNIPVILHSSSKNPETVAHFMNGGISAFVTKYVGWDEFMEAIDKVISGNKFISSDMRSSFSNVDQFLKEEGLVLKPVKRLFSRRESDILSFLIKGFSTKQIAAYLTISLKTVETHRKNLLKKAKVANTSALISFVFLKDYSFSYKTVPLRIGE
jgi:DNA-binding NarL/FixJ family response regulator